MLQKIEGHYKGANHKESTFDFTWDDDFEYLPVIIFAHGFKGFKDWGGFNYVSEAFVNKGYGVFKLNFSHNGTSTSDKNNFIDLESFSINTLNFEMEDIGAAENYIITILKMEISKIDINQLSIIGHSKGGVSALLYCAHANTQIKKLVTWASPSNFFRMWSAKFIKEWRTDGVQYILNARTKQRMPLSLSILEDYEKNLDRYDVTKALPKMSLPYLIVHGSNDESVLKENAIELHHFSKSSTLEIIEGANHTFGMTHPFEANKVSDYTKKLLAITLGFLSSAD